MKRFGLILSLVALLGAGAVHANTVAGDSVVVTDNATKQTFKGQHLRVVVNANDCALTLSGDVDALSVSGSKNKITITGKAAAVVVLGSNNNIAYSKKANPSAPPVQDSGKGNSIKAQ